MTQKSVLRPGRSAGPGTGHRTSGDAAAAATGLAPLDRRVIVAGGVVFAVLMVLSPWYGFHRDELYFLDCARHLQASYVDQPVLTPLLAWVSLKLFGVWLPGLRLWPALAAAATVVISGLTARELGGGRRAQLLAAAATATMPALLGAGHQAGPTSVDMLAWAALALVAVRVGRTGQPRWWLAAGAILGLGLANKHSIGFFALALVAGALLSGGWKMVANRWFVAGQSRRADAAAPGLERPAAQCMGMVPCIPMDMARPRTMKRMPRITAAHDATVSGSSIHNSAVRVSLPITNTTLGSGRSPRGLRLDLRARSSTAGPGRRADRGPQVRDS